MTITQDIEYSLVNQDVISRIQEFLDDRLGHGNIRFAALSRMQESPTSGSSARSSNLSQSATCAKYELSVVLEYDKMKLSYEQYMRRLDFKILEEFYEINQSFRSEDSNLSLSIEGIVFIPSDESSDTIINRIRSKSGGSVGTSGSRSHKRFIGCRIGKYLFDDLIVLQA